MCTWISEASGARASAPQPHLQRAVGRTLLVIPHKLWSTTRYKQSQAAYPRNCAQPPGTLAQEFALGATGARCVFGRGGPLPNPLGKSSFDPARARVNPSES